MTSIERRNQYLIRDGEREGVREKEGVRDCGGSGERERQKEGHSLSADESEREGGGGAF